MSDIHCKLPSGNRRNMNAEERILNVGDDDAGSRLDQYLAAHLSDISRSRAQTLIRSGHVQVGGRNVKPSHKVQTGESIRVAVEKAEPLSCEAEDIPLNIMFEDEHILIVDKPAGMVVHPAAGARTGTLVNALVAHTNRLSTTGGVDRPGIVHRLDRNTSGLLVVAKTEAAHRVLAEGISRRAVKRQYRAMAYGDFAESAGTIDAPIGRSPSDRKKMAVVGVRSRKAETHFAVQERLGGVSHLTVQLSTGRTHQIRVHMAHIGHPIIGDVVYGVRLRRFHETMAPAVLEAISKLRSHMLHAECLEFDHPASGEPVRFHAPLPDEFAGFLQLVRDQVQR